MEFSSEVVQIICAGGAVLVVLVGVGVVPPVVAAAVRACQRERTRREVAAYVAEGTISADDAVRLLGQSMSPPMGHPGSNQAGSQANANSHHRCAAYRRC